MSQPYQSIGQSSQELDEIAAARPGWGGEIPEPLGHEQTDHASSVRSRRANLQAQPLTPMAGRSEPPMAAIAVVPFAGDRG